MGYAHLRRQSASREKFHMRTLKYWIFIVLVWLFTSPEPAATYNQNMRFQNFGLEQGLSQSVVNAVAQDSVGLMWFGTQDGLNKFDSHKFVVYRRNGSDSTTLSNNFISYLFVDSAGRLWVSTLGGLNLYDPGSDSFIRYLSNPTDPNTISNENITQTYEGANGYIWILSRPNGLDRLDPETGEIKRYLSSRQPTVNSPEQIKGDVIFPIIGDSQGNIWVVSRVVQDTVLYNALNRIDSISGNVRSYSYLHEPALNDSIISTFCIDKNDIVWIGSQRGGLSRLDPKKNTLAYYLHDSADSASISHNFINGIYESRGCLWIATFGGGLNRFDLETERFTSFRHDPDDPYSISSDVVFLNIPNFLPPRVPIFEDAQGMIWVMTNAQGVDILDPQTGRFTRCRRDKQNPHSLIDVQVEKVFQDRSGVIWLGLFGGISKFSPTKEKFKRFEHDPRAPTSLSSEMVWAFMEDETGAVWVGTRNGLNRLDREKGTFDHIFADPDDPDGLCHSWVTSLCPDQLGIFWIGTQNGLNRYNQKTGLFDVFRNVPEDRSSLITNGIISLYKDSYDTLWVGTDQGLCKFNREDQTFTSQPLIFDDEPIINRNIVMDILEEDSHRLWIATWDGLKILDRRTGEVTRYANDSQDPTSLTHNSLIDLHKERDGCLWIGTVGGLELFNPSSETFTHITTADGLPNDFVYSIIEDDQGCLWLSTNKGICRFNPQTYEFQNYDFEDGLQSNEFNIKAGLRTRDREIFFGGINGFNVFHPDEIKAGTFRPPVILTGISKLKKPMESGMALTEIEEIKITHEENFIGFEFVALDYSNPSAIQYAYMLEGFDDDWIYCGNRNFAGYTNLDGGEYVFRAIATNSDGLWNREGLSIKLISIPPFWKTIWFYFLEALFAIGLIAGLFFYQRRRYQYEIEFKRKSSELDFARRIQLSMLPKKSVSDEHVEIIGKIMTATEVGGDYYDFTELAKGRYCVAIGDATGHGAAAGLFVGMVKMTSIYAIKTMKQNTPLDKLVADMNIALKRSLNLTGMGMCFCISILDLNEHKIEICSAGMPFPYHYQKYTGMLIPLVMKGPPLGFLSRIHPEMVSTRIDPGDTLIFLSDGFEERFNYEDETWGDEPLEKELYRLCRANYDPERIAEGIFDACDRFSDGRINNDDMTIVVIRIKQ
ncbi:MAG: hypothetical protein B6244_13980 [Candidatus Cloacimonetes bacterium 4572_55]|nr:MAG: hypothetical protein B6244_13980 [Candidatus Cloacimonetes bacterium 4572_55]